MKSALCFRLYPDCKQEARMLRTLKAGRRLWNEALAHRKARWEKERKSTSYSQQCSILTAERQKADSELVELYSQAGQDILRRLDRAFRSFFEHRAGYPRFKKFSESGSFTYPQAYNGSVKPDVGRKRLFLSKVGNVPIVFHRPLPLPSDSRLKTCTIVRESDGKWFASLVFEEIVPLQRDIGVAGSVVRERTPAGIDLGLLSLIATSDGEKVEHPRFLRKAEKRLKRVQRVLSHKKKGSKNRDRARQRVASQHSRVRCQRLDFNHKLSARLVKEHGFIAFEDLRVRNMVRNPKLAKSIQDAGWGQLVRLTEYKALKAGSIVVRVPAAYSTQECSYCETLNEVALGVLQFECCGCHRLLDRDTHAAKVVLKRGLAIAGLTGAKVGQDMPELKPVEMEPLLVQSTRLASSIVEAGTTRDVNETNQSYPSLEAHEFSRGRMSLEKAHGKPDYERDRGVGEVPRDLAHLRGERGPRTDDERHYGLDDLRWGKDPHKDEQYDDDSDGSPDF
jgi:putative transposase